MITFGFTVLKWENCHYRSPFFLVHSGYMWGARLILHSHLDCDWTSTKFRCRCRMSGDGLAFTHSWVHATIPSMDGYSLLFEDKWVKGSMRLHPKGWVYIRAHAQVPWRPKHSLMDLIFGLLRLYFSLLLFLLIFCSMKREAKSQLQMY